MLDKIRVAEKLDAFGIDYIEGGWPGSNPKDAAFFDEAAQREWKHAKIAAFGMTRRGRMRVEDDSQVQMLLDAKTPCRDDRRKDLAAARYGGLRRQPRRKPFHDRRHRPLPERARTGSLL